MVTQVPNGDLRAGIDLSDMMPDPLGFVSGALKKSELISPTLEEELST